MKELLNKSILNQMYKYRKEDFEKSVYESEQEIKDIEADLRNLGEKLIKFLEKAIHNKKECKEAIDIFKNYDMEYCKQIDFWSCAYFKLGMIDRKKLRNELLEKSMQLEETDTFLNNYDDDLLEYIEDNKIKYSLGTKEYKELRKKYSKIVDKYPKVAEVFEDMQPVELNKEEIKALCELRDIDIQMGAMEKKICFKLGMKEVINF